MAVEKIVILHLCVVWIKRNPFDGGRQCELPGCLRREKSILTLRECPLGQCFAYAYAASLLNIKVHPAEIKQYTGTVESFKSIRHLMALTGIPAFERVNGIGVIVFSWNTKHSGMKVLYHSSIGARRDHNCNLLLYKWHYHVVRSLNSLASGKYRCTSYVCRKCFVTFGRAACLKRHMKYCGKPKKQRYTVPPKGRCIMFGSFRSTFRSQFVYYADFESIDVQFVERKGKKTKLTHKHNLSSCQFRHHESLRK